MTAFDGAPPFDRPEVGESYLKNNNAFLLEYGRLETYEDRVLWGERQGYKTVGRNGDHPTFEAPVDRYDAMLRSRVGNERVQDMATRLTNADRRKVFWRNLVCMVRVHRKVEIDGKFLAKDPKPAWVPGETPSSFGDKDYLKDVAQIGTLLIYCTRCGQSVDRHKVKDIWGFYRSPTKWMKRHSQLPWWYWWLKK